MGLWSSVADIFDPAGSVPHPSDWVRDRLHEHPWSKQDEVLDSVYNHRRTAVQACHDVGKALSLDTPLWTPTGWTTMGDVEVGDSLYDERGQPTVVVAVTPVHQAETYRVTFDDGTHIDAAGPHEWAVLDAHTRHRLRQKKNTPTSDWREHWGASRIVETADLVDVETEQLGRRWAIPTAEPLVPDRNLDPEIGPYTLGAWLGDGTSCRGEITENDQDWETIKVEIESEGYLTTDHAARYKHGVRGLFKHLRLLRLLGNKHIPLSVMNASYSYRLSVMQGLMDTDGHAHEGQCWYDLTLSNKQLATDAATLARTLGWKVRVTERSTSYNGKDCGPAWRVKLRPVGDQVTRLLRKQRPIEGSQSARHTIRTVVSVEPLGSHPVKCVEVDSPSHLFLAGEAMVPTHNSFIAARIAAWWIETHPPGTAFVISTAPTFSQVRAILWREIRRAHATGDLRGRVNQTEWLIGQDLVGYGRKPADWNPEAFQGIHDEFVLVIIDEAAGVPRSIWTASEGLITNDNARILAIGNPDVPNSRFHEVCTAGSGWNRILISAFDSPNFTDEPVPMKLRKNLISPAWVEEKANDWGEDNPLYIAKVLGLFPEESDDTLIPMSWITDAANTDFEELLERPVLGADIARMGNDRTVLGKCWWYPDGRRKYRQTRELKKSKTTEATAAIIAEMVAPPPACRAQVDEEGVGGGVVDELEQQHVEVVPMQSGSGALDNKRFENARAEWWWTVRELFEKGKMDIEPDESLMAELAILRWELTEKGRIKIESKKTMAKRGVKSPDLADTLMFASVDTKGTATIAVPMGATKPRGL